MTQQSVRATGKNRSEALAVRRKSRMADGEDTAVKAVKAARTGGVRNSVPRVPQRTRQLTDRDNPMLPPRQLRERLVSPLPLRA